MSLFNQFFLLLYDQIRTKDVAEENVYDAVTIDDESKIYEDIVSIKKSLGRHQV